MPASPVLAADGAPDTGDAEAAGAAVVVAVAASPPVPAVTWPAGVAAASVPALTLGCAVAE
ncbi:hypothetical protein ACFWHW_09310 [Streptomyces pharetrae]|uniref:hypothetical protein n=1 Tax=Streptomyces pharetrae TaxID=291370 RepID=UPI003662EAC4